MRLISGMRGTAVTLASLLLVQAGGLPLGAQEASDVFRFEGLAEGVYAAIVLPEPDAYAFSNSLVVVGERGVLVVDTQQSPRAARALIGEIEARTDLPVRWVVNTHWHGDHVNGNSAYRAHWPEVEFYATRGTLDGMRGPGAQGRAEELVDLPESIRERERWLQEGSLPGGQQLDARLRAQVEYSFRMRRIYYDELRGLEVVLPEAIVDALTRLDLGGRSVTLVPAGRAHTEGDLAVFLEEDGILAVGDLLEEAAPWIDGAYLTGWASALETLQELDPVLLLPSHARGPTGRTLLDQEAGLLGAVVAVARLVAHGEADPTDVLPRLESYRTFMSDLGVSSEALDSWALEATEQAVGEIHSR